MSSKTFDQSERGRAGPVDANPNFSQLIRQLSHRLIWWSSLPTPFIKLSVHTEAYSNVTSACICTNPDSLARSVVSNKFLSTPFANQVMHPKLRQTSSQPIAPW